MCACVFGFFKKSILRNREREKKNERRLSLSLSLLPREELVEQGEQWHYPTQVTVSMPIEKKIYFQGLELEAIDEQLESTLLQPPPQAPSKGIVVYADRSVLVLYCIALHCIDNLGIYTIVKTKGALFAYLSSLPLPLLQYHPRHLRGRHPQYLALSHRGNSASGLAHRQHGNCREKVCEHRRRESDISVWKRDRHSNRGARNKPLQRQWLDLSGLVCVFVSILGKEENKGERERERERKGHRGWLRDPDKQANKSVCVCMRVLFFFLFF